MKLFKAFAATLLLFVGVCKAQTDNLQEFAYIYDLHKVAEDMWIELPDPKVTEKRIQGDSVAYVAAGHEQGSAYLILFFVVNEEQIPDSGDIQLVGKKFLQADSIVLFTFHAAQLGYDTKAFDETLYSVRVVIWEPQVPEIYYNLLNVPWADKTQYMFVWPGGKRHIHTNTFERMMMNMSEWFLD